MINLVNSQNIAAENYCNGVVYGRQNMNINSGYWNIVTENFDYIRFITGVGFTTHIMLQPILFLLHYLNIEDVSYYRRINAINF